MKKHPIHGTPCTLKTLKPTFLKPNSTALATTHLYVSKPDRSTCLALPFTVLHYDSNFKTNCHRHARHDGADRTVLSCLVWQCELSRPDCPRSAICVKVCRAAQCDLRTHSNAERTCPAVNSHRHTRQDKTAAPASRPPPPRRRPGRQLRVSLEIDQYM